MTEILFGVIIFLFVLIFINQLLTKGAIMAQIDDLSQAISDLTREVNQAVELLKNIPNPPPDLGPTIENIKALAEKLNEFSPEPPPPPPEGEPV